MDDQTIAVLVCVVIPAILFYGWMAWIGWGPGGIFRKPPKD